MPEEFYLAQTTPIDQDHGVDEGIQECLKIGSGKSFITFAGAGSGKTFSLKKALDCLNAQHSKSFSQQGKQIAVVTFTNNAADEIKDRIESSPVFAVSTIHSFCWSAINGFNEDIRKWYLDKIPADLDDLILKEQKGRAGKASDARKRSIIRLNEKLEWLAEPRKFIYDPNGVNSSQNSLSHSDVLKIFSSFLTDKPMMAEVIVNKFPFIFIDESQDTDKDVINAFFSLHNAKSENVVIGLFGDTMQRIFGGGERELGKSKPVGWVPFDKQMNHRSTRRIVGLGNQIRSEDDGRKQFAREGSSEGIVRFFLLPYGVTDKESVEVGIRESMAKITCDADWENTDSKQTAILLLEHKMAARRLGFYELWDKLSKSKKINDRVSDGSNTELNFFANIVFPLAKASLNENRAEIMSILRAVKSPLLEPAVLEVNKDDPLASARKAEHAFKNVIENKTVSFRDVLGVLAEFDLLKIPSKLKSFVKISEESTASLGQLIEGMNLDYLKGMKITPNSTDKVELTEDIDDDEMEAWAEALETNFIQIGNYKEYIDDKSVFRTHQGVKGNEFERVMVIMDDDEAGGFMFSYEEYFGVKETSPAIQAKLDAGEETRIDATRRLFYVTSTRAENSLAHVIYTSDVAKLHAKLIERKFAVESEIIDLA